MSSAKSAALLSALVFASTAAAHGVVTGIVADGVYYQGYSPSFQYQKTPPTVAGWSIPEDKDTGFVSDYTSPDIICHKGATPGQTYAKVSAGGQITLQWTKWPESHHGPMIDYLANCNGECTDVKKEDLLFNKIDEKGLNNGSPSPGNWASDDMIANNNSWTVTIPSSIAPGKYVLRHETIALHSANNIDGAQNYPQCINLEITGSGDNKLPTGTKGTDLYNRNDPGIFVNIYYPPLKNYTIPGPAVMDGASNTNPQPKPSSTASPSSSSGSPTGAPYGNSTSSTTAESSPVKDATTTSAQPTTLSTVTGKPPASSTTPCPESDSTVTATSTITVTVTAEGDGKGYDSPKTQNNQASTTATTTTQSFTTTVSAVADATNKPSDSGLPTGKPKKFVCYEVED